MLISLWAYPNIPDGFNIYKRHFPNRLSHKCSKNKKISGSLSCSQKENVFSEKMCFNGPD